MRKPISGFPTGSSTNRAVQPQKMARYRLEISDLTLIFFPRLPLLAEYFFPILYKIGTFPRSALHVKVNFGSKTYDSRS